MDLLGVGIGPFNLSLAALLTRVRTVKSYFFDAKNEFSWHPGLMLPNSEIQVGHFKDLVTLVDPTNPYSFLAYLVQHKRLYRFMNCDFSYVLRYEFNDYLRWVANSLPNLFFDEKVIDLNFNNNFFILHTTKNSYQARNIVLGNGLTPKIPGFIKPYLGKDVFHSNDYLQHETQDSIAIIGGGQSAAEIVSHLLNKPQLPKTIYWISSRGMLLPMDNSPFSTEYFHPKYNEYFYNLPANRRSQLLREQLLASDGISERLLTEIYQQFYLLNLQGKKIDFRFIPHSKLINMSRDKEVFHLGTAEKSFSVKTVILCTGYEWTMPDYLISLKDRIEVNNGKFRVNKDYSIQWDGPAQNRIYIQNGAEHTHGIADRNLSLMAFRSATIINSLMQQTIYDIANESAAIDWDYVGKIELNWRNVSNG